LVGPQFSRPGYRHSGSLELTINTKQQTRSVHFEFNDRGRGPSIDEVIRFDGDGKVIGLNIRGHSYMGAPVNEQMEVTSQRVNWKSTIETGDSEDTTAFYVANDSSFEQLAVLARLLLEKPSGQSDLLPGGTASIRKLNDLSVPVANQSKTITLYAISGLGFQPEFLWLDERRELFGVSAGSNALLPAGLANLAPELKKVQDKAELAFYKDRSQPLTHLLSGEYVITNVNVVDVESGSVAENRSVVVSDGIIQSVETPGREFATNTKQIDANGQWLIPGLWDMHTHNRFSQGLLHIAGGVTTVRDMGNNPENYFQVRDGFDSGEVIGPRSFAAGIVEGKSPFSAPIKALAESENDAVELVRKYAGLGYPQIKIYSSAKPEWIKSVAAEARRNQMRVSGHIPSFMSAEKAVVDGYDEIQHINMLFLNFLAKRTDDTRTPLRFTLIAEKAHELDLDSEDVKAFLSLLKNEDVTIDPTVAIFDNMLRHRSGKLSPSFAMVADHFPPSVKRGMMAGRMDITEENASRFAASADALLILVRKLHENGIRIVAGTDSLPGFGLHRELELYQKAGIPTADILRLATLGSAQLMSAADKNGSISVGKQADFALLASNPLEDIGAVRKVRFIFKGDRYFIASELHQAVGIKPFSY
jgi:cytosine/adenosine deaminase-related metal-dependent hydrolase